MPRGGIALRFRSGGCVPRRGSMLAVSGTDPEAASHTATPPAQSEVGQGLAAVGFGLIQSVPAK